MQASAGPVRTFSDAEVEQQWGAVREARQNGRVTGKSRLALAAFAGTAVGAYALLVRGSLTLDIGIGRRERPLAPLTWHIAAPRELVFEVISAPYLDRTPHALESKLHVLERGEQMVLAEHYTRVGPFLTTTLETVRFEPPERVHFRLVRGPVPHVVEEFRLCESGTGTEIEYSGTLETDLWAMGRLWGAAVARRWDGAVRESLDAVKAEAERRAARR
jgi:Polyketide cyclase / dehydrase and lipid transport